MKHISIQQLQNAIEQQHQEYGICCDCMFFVLCTEYRKEKCEEYINFYQKVLDLSSKGLIKDNDDDDLL